MHPIELAESESRLRLLELADTVQEDEYGTSEYTFLGSGVQLRVQRNRYDGDTKVTLVAEAQLEPVVAFELKAYKHLVVGEQAGVVSIELEATSALEPRSRGTYRSEAGIRLTLRPFVQVAPYFRSHQAASADQGSAGCGKSGAA